MAAAELATKMRLEHALRAPARAPVRLPLMGRLWSGTAICVPRKLVLTMHLCRPAINTGSGAAGQGKYKAFFALRCANMHAKCALSGTVCMRTPA